VLDFEGESQKRKAGLPLGPGKKGGGARIIRRPFRPKRGGKKGKRLKEDPFTGAPGKGGRAPRYPKLVPLEEEGKGRAHPREKSRGQTRKLGFFEAGEKTREKA